MVPTPLQPVNSRIPDAFGLHKDHGFHSSFQTFWIYHPDPLYVRKEEQMKSQAFSEFGNRMGKKNCKNAREEFRKGNKKNKEGKETERQRIYRRQNVIKLSEWTVRNCSYNETI